MKGKDIVAMTINDDENSTANKFDNNQNNYNNYLSTREVERSNLS
jgi:hypothetical protein